MNRILVFLTVLALACTVGRAEPVTLSKTEAAQLHVALTALSPGLSPENTFAAADCITALNPTFVSYQKAYAKLSQLQQTASSAGALPEAIAKFHDEDEKFAAVAEQRQTYELTVFVFTKDEVKPIPGVSPGISASQLSIIRRLLKADAKPDRVAASAAPQGVK